MFPAVIIMKRISEKILSKVEEAVAKVPFIYLFLKKCKVQYQRLKYAILEKSGNGIDKMFDEDFFNRNLEMNVPIAEKFVEIVIKYFHPNSVVDVGCGNAEFLAQFQKRNIEVKGYEGSRHALERALIDRIHLEYFDLRN